MTEGSRSRWNRYEERVVPILVMLFGLLVCVAATVGGGVLYGDVWLLPLSDATPDQP